MPLPHEICNTKYILLLKLLDTRVFFAGCQWHVSLLQELLGKLFRPRNPNFCNDHTKRLARSHITNHFVVDLFGKSISELLNRLHEIAHWAPFLVEFSADFGTDTIKFQLQSVVFISQQRITRPERRQHALQLVELFLYLLLLFRCHLLLLREGLLV